MVNFYKLEDFTKNKSHIIKTEKSHQRVRHSLTQVALNTLSFLLQPVFSHVGSYRHYFDYQNEATSATISRGRQCQTLFSSGKKNTNEENTSLKKSINII